MGISYVSIKCGHQTSTATPSSSSGTDTSSGPSSKYCALSVASTAHSHGGTSQRMLQNFAKLDMFSQPYFGNLLPAQSNGQGWCINSGAFGGITLHIGPGTGFQNHCMTRAVNEQLTAQCNQGYVDLCKSRGTFAEFASCFEGGPHAYGHNGIGGVMSDVYSSPSDPTFWMHHLFVDHTYRVWQGADPSRLQTLNGNDAQGNPLTLDTIVSVNGIRPDVRVRDIINTLGGTVIGGVPFCYRYNY